MTQQLALCGGQAVADWRGRTPLTRVSREVLAEVASVVESGVWDGRSDSSGVARCERAWGSFNGAAHCALVTNGTHALQLAYEALDLGPGDEIVVPALTWHAPATAACDVNATPVLADVSDENGCLCVESLQRSVTARTRAVVVVHLYQSVADVAALRAFCERRGLYLIEDCAHAHGARYEAQGMGVTSDVGCYSFQMGKLLASGEGGSVFARSPRVFERLLSLRDCGRAYGAAALGSGNYRMTSLQAALLLPQIRALDGLASTIDSRLSALEAAVAAAPGVRPIALTPSVSRRCGFRFAFHFESAAFDDVPAAAFRAALSAELGIDFGGGEGPLGSSTIYRPHLRARHLWAPSRGAALDPALAELPVASDLHAHRFVVTGWGIYGVEPAEAGMLTQAVAKIFAQRDSLRGWWSDAREKESAPCR